MSFSFIFNEINSEQFGMKIITSNHLDSSARRIERISIPGRTGDLIIDDGSFENKSITITGTLQREDLNSLKVIKDKLTDWLQSPVGYRTLSISDGAIFNAVCEGFSIKQIYSTFADFSITFSAYEVKS